MANAPSANTGASFSSSRRETCPNLRCVIVGGTILGDCTCNGLGGGATTSGAADFDGADSCLPTTGSAGREAGSLAAGVFGCSAPGLLFSGSMTFFRAQ